jgi:hypothetical protein
MTPYVVSAVFVLGVMVACWARPNAGRIFLGFFYLAMALGVNGFFILTAPQGYIDYVSQSFWPLYREAAVWTVNLLGPVVFGVLLVAYEVAVGVLLLSKGRGVRLGLLGLIVHIVGITPLGLIQIPWLGFAVAAGYLLQKEFPQTVVEMMGRRVVRQVVAQ